MVQWLRLCTFNAGYTVLIPGQGTCCVASPKSFKKSAYVANSLGVKHLGLQALTAEGPSSIPSQGTKVPQPMRLSQKKKKIVEVINSKEGTRNSQVRGSRGEMTIKWNVVSWVGSWNRKRTKKI